MLNPVLSQKLGSIIVGLVVFAGQSSCAVAQDRAGGYDELIREWPAPIYGIRAQGSLGTRLEITMEPGSELRARAILTQGGSQWIATTDQCEHLSSAIDAFRRLPPVKPGPLVLQPPLPEGVVVPPRKTGGETWTVQTSAYALDGIENEILLRGFGGAYPLWVDNTVEAVKRCGPPGS
jgi:hypothetical protein